MTLTDFLLARIAEDEEVARGAVRWSEGASQWADDGEPDWIHIARHDPARVLAECDAKRRIVAEHPIYRGSRILAVDSSPTDYGCELCHCIDPVRADGIIEANGYCETLLALALPYADHPAYREEWRP